MLAQKAGLQGRPAGWLGRSFNRLCLVPIWLAVLVTTACASSMRPADKALELEITSLAFVGGSSGQMLFEGVGNVINPNEVDVSRVGFTYQTFLNGQLIDSGRVYAPILFKFKSRTAFRVPLRIATSDLGGYIQATRTDGINYKFDLQITDSNFRRTSLVHQGILNLSPLLHLPTISIAGGNYSGEVMIDAELHNPNSFVLVIDRCTIKLGSHEYGLFTNTAIAPDARRNFRVAVKEKASGGQQLNITSQCVVDGQGYSNNHLPVLR